MADRLTSTQILQQALTGSRAGRVPCICPGGMMNMLTCDMMQRSNALWPDAHSDAVTMAKLAAFPCENGLFDNIGVPFTRTWPAFLTTLTVMAWTVLISTIIGFILAIIMDITKEDGLHPNRHVSRLLDFLINLIRSFPFVILMVSVIPVTRFVIGSSIGVKAAIFPLCITMSPYMARLIQSHMDQVSKETIEAAKSFGASTFQINTRLSASGAQGVSTQLPLYK